MKGFVWVTRLWYDADMVEVAAVSRLEEDDDGVPQVVPGLRLSFAELYDLVLAPKVVESERAEVA